MAETLAHRVATLDRARFRGRAHELAVLERLLADGTAGAVVLLHGPGGMGKSALLRELVRRAEAAGLVPRVLDGRELAPVPGELERALDGVQRDDRPLVVIDSYELISGADGWLRSVLLPELPDRSVVILSGRGTPADAWFDGGWEHVAVEIELGPLDDGDARAMLVAHGVTDQPVEELLRWARGWPLALSLAAASSGGAPTASTAAGGRSALMRAAVARLARDDVGAASGDVLAVAAVARRCDARLLRAVLPLVEPAEAMRRLRSLTFAERVGGGLALHDLVRRAVRAELEDRDPERAAELRRRIADHVHDRAVGEDPRMLIDLTELIDDPALRWGLGAEGNAAYRIDSVRAGDPDALAPWYRGRERWWRDVDAFLTEAPDRVVLARDARDQLAGIAIGVTLADPPPNAESDAVLGPWLQDARRRAAGGAVLLWRDATDFGRNADPGSPVVSLMNTAIILGSGLTNPRLSYIPVDASNPAAVRFSRAVGGVEIPQLAVHLDGRRLECHLIDHGPSGMIGQLRQVLYGELRVPTSSIDLADAVREALRDLHRPPALATSPLASGATLDERVASTRALITRAVETAFGDTPQERLLRAVLERGYLDPQTTHEQAAVELSLSRTAYFRRLRQASERVAAWIAERPRA